VGSGFEPGRVRFQRMIARRYPVVFVPTNKSPAQGGLPFHSAQFLPLSRGQP
jgi:hypothetical protein